VVERKEKVMEKQKPNQITKKEDKKHE